MFEIEKSRIPGIWYCLTEVATMTMAVTIMSKVAVFTVVATAMLMMAAVTVTAMVNMTGVQ